MTDYYLFIDTEASGLPHNWFLPYSADHNWPHAVQISWLVYGPDRQLIKKADHYILNQDFTITPAAIDVHGITPEFLAENGVRLDMVLAELTADISQYRPTLVGHFIRLDYYVLSAEFYRTGKQNPLKELAVFCTMEASGQLRRSKLPRQLQLSELYHFLFNREPENPHNSFFDAKATAESFFKLLNSGEIATGDLLRQNKDSQNWRDPAAAKSSGCAPILLLFLLSGLIIYLWTS